MNRKLFFTGMMYCLLCNLNAQFCNEDSCYKDGGCFSDVQVNNATYIYSTVQNIYQSATASVKLNITVYSPCNLPQKLEDTDLSAKCWQCTRPFILLIHGGGFRNGCKNLMNNECLEFAKRGYVAATINYRVGWAPGDEQMDCENFCITDKCSKQENDICKPIYADSLDFAVYRAVQDASAALRFMVHNANKFSIDTNYLYIGGYSAGSIIAANICYMNQSDFNKAIPKAASVLGSLNSYGNNFTDKYNIAGFYNNWGSLKDTTLIKGDKDKIPMIAFHGIDDNVVPFLKGPTLGCKTAPFGFGFGSCSVYYRLINNYPDLPVELYAAYGGHGIFNNDPEKDPKSLYRIQKAVCFFNRVRNNDKRKNYVYFDKNDDDISYDELISTSPIKCNYKKKRIDTDGIPVAWRLNDMRDEY